MTAFLLAACSDDPGKRPDDTGTPPDPLALYGDPGAYAVGYAELEVTWQDDLQTEPRVLRTGVWFPTDAESGDAVVYGGIFPAEGVLGGVAPIADPLPLALFSHGHQGFAANSSFLMRHLASHGWAVAAPDHTGNTTFDGSERETAIYWQRPEDLAAVLGEVRDGGVAGLALTDDLAVIGHSFGGYTTFAATGAAYAQGICPDDTDFCSTMTPDQEARLAGGLAIPGVAAAVAMAPGDFRLFGAAGVAAADVPLLLMSGGNDPNTDVDAYWDAMAGGARVHLPTMGHQGFTDFSGTLGDPAGSIDPELGWHVVETYVLAWLEREVRGDARADALLDPGFEVDPSATFSTR